MSEWCQSADVESNPGKVSGHWVIKGTPVPAQAVIDNAEDGFPTRKMGLACGR
jgi:uncharacterized protein (DUF433 family)